MIERIFSGLKYPSDIFWTACQVVPEPANGYDVIWPDLGAPSEKDKAEYAKIYSEALSKYTMSPDTLIHPDIYLKKVMGWTQSEVDDEKEAMQDLIAEERMQLEEDKRLMEEERIRQQRQQPGEGDEE